MNGENENAGFIRLINTTTGEEIAAFDSIPIQTITVEPEDLKERENLSFMNKEIIGTVGNVVFNTEYLAQVLPGARVDVVGYGVQLPPGKKMPKTKRLRKKWSKKYRKEFRFNDCELF